MAIRRLKELLSTSDGAFTFKYFEDGSVLVVPNKVPQTAQLTGNDAYYTRQGRMLLAVESGTITNQLEWRAASRPT